MGHRTIFLPMMRGEADVTEQGASLHALATKMKSEFEAKQHTADVVCIDGAFTGNVADAGREIYIYSGHGLPGVGYASWPGDPGTTTTQKKVYPGDVAAAISTRGFSPNLFTGRVKIWSCYSAAEAEGVFQPTGEPKSYGRLVAAAMRDLHWSNCSFWGYNWRISKAKHALNMAAQIQIKNMLRKELDIEDVDDRMGPFAGKHYWSSTSASSGGKTLGRASEFRTQL